ncbi:DNA starvation/stationary phase protection protein [Treponema sp. OMZ 305]|uniref:Dps family protein n=1 Tax=Treponema TaxID=157 RepID=UPI001BAEE4F6|nr:MULTISPECIES: DNA starvation/stationary phase protection protein [Treponema]QUY17422.1 DNA starvation/stationary phase protection protein [Treponema vincentii]UTC57269.1 DNA starvation/stationary phase protection protein [Treponema sp. OMZ 305]
MTKELGQKLNLYLANQLVDYVKKHNLHWNLKGSNFFTLHAKLEELYDEAGDILDEVAERILSLGGNPVSNMKEALAIATIKELEDGPKSTEQTIKTLIADTDCWIKDSKEIVELAEKEEDGVTADMFNGYTKDYQKLAWMLKAYQS